MFRIRLVASAVTAAIAATSALPLQAAEYSNAIFFGDSLSDAGTYRSQPPLAGIYPIAGKFTTNPGPVWSEVVADRLGHATSPANTGGTDYAAGGARVSAQPGYPNSALVPYIQAAPSVADQVTSYLAANGGRADSRALFAVWAGANDLFALQDGDAAYNALQMPQVAADLTQQVARLKAAGARYILVLNLPDIGATPDSIDGGAAVQSQSTRLSQTYNQALYSTLAAQGIEVIPIDTYGLLQQLISNAAAFGISNTTERACGGLPSSLVCGESDYAAGTDQSYVFADGVHPTTVTHGVLADYVLSVLSAPQQIALLADSAVAERSALHELLRTQLQDGRVTREKTGRNVWLSAQGAGLDRDSRRNDPGAEENGYQLAVGADYQLAPQWVVGAALSFSDHDADYSANRGDYSQQGITVSLYGDWHSGAWYSQGALAYGDLDYSTHRRVPLGITAYTAKGDTNGSNFSAQLEGGYEMTLDRLVTGPVVGLLAQDLSIDGFRESGAGVVDLGYATQHRNTLVGSAGWQFRYLAQGVQPYGRIAVNHDFEDDEHSVTVSALSVPEALPFSMPVQSAGSTSYTAQLGLSGSLTERTRFNLAATTRFAQDEQSDWQVFGGIFVAF